MEIIGNKQTASMEDYLEAAVMLTEKGDRITVTALSKTMGVKKPSVDWALKKLGEAGLVIHEKYGDIELTQEGSRIANEVYRRHKSLYKFLTEILKVQPDIADKDACGMEHVLSRESIRKLEKFISFVLECHPGLADWDDIFNRYITYGKEDSLLRSRFSRES